MQGKHILNAARKGWGDPRSRQPVELRRIIKEIREITSIPCYAFLENVASTPSHVIEKYSALLSTRPIEVNASAWGYVHRRRLFWLAGPAGGIKLGNPPTMPLGYELASKGKDYAVAQRDPRPWPRTVRLENGFSFFFTPAQVAKGKQAAAHNFTR